jgi:hypothetical protein
MSEVRGGAVVVLYGFTWRNTGSEPESDQSKPRLRTCELLAWDSESFNMRNACDAPLIWGDARATGLDGCFCDKCNGAVIFTLVP